MNELIETMLPTMIIISLLSILWTVKYPEEHWEYLTFGSGDGVAGFFISLAIVSFDLVTIATIGYACSFIPTP